MLFEGVVIMGGESKEKDMMTESLGRPRLRLNCGSRRNCGSSNILIGRVGGGMVGKKGADGVRGEGG